MLICRACRYHFRNEHSRHPLNSGYPCGMLTEHITLTPTHCHCLRGPNTSKLAAAEPLQAALTAGQCRWAGSSWWDRFCKPHQMDVKSWSIGAQSWSHLLRGS